MAKTIIIKGADFSANSLDKVVFQNVESIPCTDITLDDTVLNIENIGTSTNLIAIKTPVNTTDVVNWSSSNPNVATVDKNGCVTAIGVGSAIITATCGKAMASCDVSITSVFDGVKLVGVYFSGNGVVDGGNGLATVDSNVHSVGLCATQGNLGFHGNSQYYPYVIPKGTSKLKFTLSGSAAEMVRTIDRILWFNHNTSVLNYPNNCKLIKRTRSVQITENVFYVDIPVFEGYPEIDAFAMILRNASGTPSTEDEANGIKLEFV